MNLEDLYKKYPFIYEVNQEYYFIGMGICKNCKSGTAISYYKQFLNCVQSIGEDIISSQRSDIDEECLDSLLYYFRKVKAYSDIAVDEKDKLNYRNEIYQFISGLDENEKNRLIQQLSIFVNTFRYYYKGCKK